MTTMPRACGIIIAAITTHQVKSSLPATIPTYIAVFSRRRKTRQKTKHDQHKQATSLHSNAQRPAIITTRGGSMIQNKVMSSTLPPASNVTTGSKPYIVEDRTMISRSSGDRGNEHPTAFGLIFLSLTII